MKLIEILEKMLNDRCEVVLGHSDWDHISITVNKKDILLETIDSNTQVMPMDHIREEKIAGCLEYQYSEIAKRHQDYLDETNPH